MRRVRGRTYVISWRVAAARQGSRQRGEHGRARETSTIYKKRGRRGERRSERGTQWRKEKKKARESGVL